VSSSSTVNSKTVLFKSVMFIPLLSLGLGPFPRPW